MTRGRLLNYVLAENIALAREHNDRIQYQLWATAKADYAAAAQRDKGPLKAAVKRTFDQLEQAGLAKRLCVRGARPLPWWRLEEKGHFSIHKQLGKCVHP